MEEEAFVHFGFVLLLGFFVMVGHLRSLAIVIELLIDDALEHALVSELKLDDLEALDAVWSIRVLLLIAKIEDELSNDSRIVCDCHRQGL